jgi:hypothetical protein
MDSIIAIVLIANFAAAQTTHQLPPPDVLYEFFTPGILTGLITILLFIVILLVGVCCMMQIESSVPTLPKQKKT